MNSIWFFFIIETRLKIPFIVRIGRLTVCPQNRLLGWGDQRGEKTSAYIIKENRISRLEIFKKNLKWTKSQSLHCLLTLSISKDLPVPSRTTTQEVADWGIAKCDRDVGVVGDVGIRPGVDLVIKTFYFVCFFRELFTLRLAKPNLTKDWSKWDLLKICPQINS